LPKASEDSSGSCTALAQASVGDFAGDGDKASSSVPEAGGGGGASGDDAFDAACYPPSRWCRT